MMNQLTGTLTSQSLPILPFDLIPEILCRLPIKFLLQFRCVCKSWNYLISDLNFAKKQLLLSTTFCIHIFNYSPSFRDLIIKSYQFDSVFNDITTNHNVTHIIDNLKHYYTFVGSCNGILCHVDFYKGAFRLWNPSIGKFKMLPPFTKTYSIMMFGFGYNSVTQNYEVVVVLGTYDKIVEIKVHTLGTNFWKIIHNFSSSCVPVPLHLKGKFVRGTINWLTYKSYTSESQHCIYSLDLGNESYQEVSVPDYGKVDPNNLYLGVLRDCLCMVYDRDVWLMKEYGNKEAWTKLFTIYYVGDPIPFYSLIKVIHIFEDDQVLLQSMGEIEEGEWKFILYNSRNSTFKVTGFQNTPHVYVESLISPFSLC